MSNTPISSTSYTLNHEQYTFTNALGWGNCRGHWKLAGEGSLGKRPIIHYLIAIVEAPLSLGELRLFLKLGLFFTLRLLLEKN